MNPEQIRFGCQIGSWDPSQVVRDCVLADKMGFDTIALADHLFHPLDERVFAQPPYEIFTTLGAVGALTKRVKLMAGVTEPVRRHPATIAHAMITLDRLSGGRAILGIGAGEAYNIRPLGLEWNRPGARLDEAVELIMALWTRGVRSRISFKGDFFNLAEAQLGLESIQKPHPPVYVGGSGTRAKRLTARLADGWFPWIETPQSYSRGMNEIKDLVKEYGRDEDELDWALTGVGAVVLEDGDEARKAYRGRQRIGISLRPGLLRDEGYESLAKKAISIRDVEFTEGEIETISALSEEVPPKLVEEVAIVGSPDDAIGKIERFLRAGVEFLLPAPQTAPEKVFSETMRIFGSRIIPYFREQRR